MGWKTQTKDYNGETTVYKLKAYSLKILVETIGYQSLNNGQDYIPHKMNFNVSGSISNIQRGQFIDMYIGNPDDQYTLWVNMLFHDTIHT